MGSLPRPSELVELLRASERGEPYDADRLVEVAREATADSVRRQCEVGIDVVNDGEQGKYSFMHYFHRRLSGFEMRERKLTMPIAAEGVDYPVYFERWNYITGSMVPGPICVGPIEYVNTDELHEDIASLQAATAGAGATEVFMTAISPATVARIATNEHYASLEEYEQALADAMALEYEAIVAAGFLLQIDCPEFGVYPRAVAMTADEQRDRVRRSVEVLNHATRGVDPERMRFHVCWGADEAPHHLDTPLDEMVDLLLDARPHGMTTVAANGRHEHEWAVWRDTRLPEGKVLVPGVIDSTTNIIEHPRTVADRIIRFAEVVGRESIIAGVDCGLDTVAGVHQVDPDIVWAKLAALSEGAQLASAELY